MRALANNRRIAALVGVLILRVEAVAWGVSWLIFGSLVRLEPAVPTFMAIPCTVAAIAGRLVSLPIVLIAGLAMGVIESPLTLSDTFKAVRPTAPQVIAIAARFPMILGGQCTGIFTSTACFAMATMGAGFMHSHLDMVSLSQVAMMGVGGWMTLRLTHAFALQFAAN